MAGGINAPAGARSVEDGRFEGASPRPGKRGTYAKNVALTQRVRCGADQAVRMRRRSLTHSSKPPARSTAGKITSLTVTHPNRASSCPEENELSAMLPKIRKSLNACTLLRSCG